MNIPNQLTISRIVLVFIFLGLANVESSRYLHVSADTQQICRIIAYFLAIFAGITDLLDGYIARKYGLESDFGRLMDPLADKIFIVAAFIMMVEKNLMAGWIAVVVISREFLVTGLRLLAVQKGEVIAADRFGKAKTLLQMLMLLVAGAGWLRWIDIDPDSQYRFYWDMSLIFIAMFTAVSGLNYYVRYRHLYLNMRN